MDTQEHRTQYQLVPARALPTDTPEVLKLNFYFFIIMNVFLKFLSASFSV